jgi:hypothetical protein
MTDGYIVRLFQRLILTGVPIVWPAGCSSCPDSAPNITEQYIEIENPANVADGGVTAEAYQRCVDRLDCRDLCVQRLPFMGIESCDRVPTDGGASGDERVALIVRSFTICEGRRPEGQGAALLPRRSRCEVGGRLARAAYLEGVSVPAFRRLARELAAHGAPPALVTGARRAARDEIRHHKMMTALACRFGAEPSDVPERFPDHVRPLSEVAIENAVEGCAREALGAVTAAHQARWARDPAIRAGFGVIARDEARHAELAFDVHAWSCARLGAAARRRVRAALVDEHDILAAEARTSEASAALVGQAGLPDAARTAVIVDEMRTLARAH